jgi:hypothetical protein
MAFCLKCDKWMEQAEAVCPSCGYPSRKAREPRRGIAYSVWADIALFVGQVVAILTCIFAGIAAGIKFCSGEIGEAIGGIIAFFLLLAMFVVFARVQDMKKD